MTDHAISYRSKTAPGLLSAKPTFSRCVELVCCRNWAGPACFKCGVQNGSFPAYVSSSTAFTVVVDLTKCRIWELKAPKSTARTRWGRLSAPHTLSLEGASWAKPHLCHSGTGHEYKLCLVESKCHKLKYFSHLSRHMSLQEDNDVESDVGKEKTWVKTLVEWPHEMDSDHAEPVQLTEECN